MILAKARFAVKCDKLYFGGAKMAIRITVRLPDEIGEQLDKYSKEWALTKSQLAGMAIQAGMGGILRAVKPEESISPELWAKITKEIEKLDPKSGKDPE